MSKKSQTTETAPATSSKSGFARKSPTSAKPARAAASSVRVVPASAKAKRKQLERGEDLSGLSKEEKRARKQEQRLQEDRIYAAQNALMRQDEEYTRRRRIFWALLAIGLVAILTVWLMLGVATEMQTVQIVALVIAYACILGSFIYDMVRIRPIRNECRAKAEGMNEKKLTSVIEKDAAARDAKRAKRKK